VNVEYHTEISAGGGTPPYTWSIASGALPVGLSLNLAGGISGAPVSRGTSSFSVRVTDAISSSASRPLSLTVVNSKLKGDVDLNGVVNIIDALLSVNYILELTDFNSDQFWASDVNGDGTVNIVDTILIVNIVLGIYPKVNPPECPASSAAVKCSEVMNHSDNSVSLLISVTTDAPIAGAEIVLAYENAYVKPGIPQLANRSRDMLVSHSVQDGKEHVVIYGTSGQSICPGTGQVVSLPFDILQEFQGEIELHIETIVLADDAGRSIPVTLLNSSVCISDDTPTDMALVQNYPNPFNSSTNIQYEVPGPSYTVISVYNVLGQKVRTLVDDITQAGSYIVHWDGLDDDGVGVAGGIYFCRMSSGEFTGTMRMVLLR
jgi:hypothetical protein